MSKKLKIAVTGGIGSGKSAVCKILHQKNYPVIYADDISKQILSENQSIQLKIKNAFGDESIVNGKPNLTFLAEHVFSNTDRVKKINSILHPPTIEQINREMQAALKNNNLVFVEAALIYEAKMEELFDYVLVVAAEDELRIKRVVDSRGLKKEEVVKRIERQMPQEKKKKLADFVIENNGSISELENKVNFILIILNL